MPASVHHRLLVTSLSGRSSLRFELNSSLFLYHKIPLSSTTLDNTLAELWGEMSQRIGRAFNPDVLRTSSHSTFKSVPCSRRNFAPTWIILLVSPRSLLETWSYQTLARARGEEAGFDRNNKADAFVSRGCSV